MQLTVIISMIFAIFIAVFAGLNSTVVPVNLLVIRPEMSLAIVILMSAVFGAAIMYLLNVIKAFKRSRELKAEIKEKQMLQKEIDELKVALEAKEKEEVTDNFEIADETPTENKSMRE
ncbi:MAG TPA: LapA family protein [Clostridia bacterium]|nr:LapA family protein [Clostridia bacterium]